MSPRSASKVAPVLAVFWVVKVLATTLGETGGDALSMSLHLGYALSTLVFLACFAVALTVQLMAGRYHALTYWTVVVATTTVGTTLSDYLDRTVGLGYVKSSALLLTAVLGTLFFWHRVSGRLHVDDVESRRDEAFYWLTILVSNTLGTALGDLVASDTGLGFERGAAVFTGLLALVGAAYFFSRVPRPVLFWAAYVLTRPLGATLGDTLTKPHPEGGLGFNRLLASGVIALAMVGVIALSRLRQPSPPPARGRAPERG